MQNTICFAFFSLSHIHSHIDLVIHLHIYEYSTHFFHSHSMLAINGTFSMNILYIYDAEKEEKIFRMCIRLEK